MKRLVLIDSHAIIHRAFHALPPLTSPAGESVQAVYGFAAVLVKMLRELKPDFVVATFDHEGPTFRHLAFERYKATRVKAPDALYQQIPLVQELVSAFGIPVVSLQGYEADDLIGTIATAVRKKHPDCEIVIVTGDLDTLQLVDERTRVFTMRKGVTDTVFYDTAAVRVRYGLPPSALVDFKGLRGDPSDNIPGVKGIGEKTASELLQAYGSIEKIYRILKKGALKAKPGVLAALKAHEADALFSKTLATIDRHVPIKFILASSRLRKPFARPEAYAILERLGFVSLLRRMADGAEKSGASTREAQPVAPALPLKVTGAATFSDLPRYTGAVVLSDEVSGHLAVAVGSSRVVELPSSAIADPAAARWIAANRPVYVFHAKPLVRAGLAYDPANIRDLMLIWYVLEPGRGSYEPAALAARGHQGMHAGATTATAAVLETMTPDIEARLRREELVSVYEDLEAPLVPILAAMEKRGIGFAKKPLTALAKTMTRELTGLETEIYTAAGERFNINSPRELRRVLFEKLDLAASGIRKTDKSGVLSTRESELVKLARLHPIVGHVLRYREIQKLKSTYVDVLPTLVRADGRIHTTWNQAGTATGRLSSANPNLQNIPTRGAYGKTIRSAFTAAPGSFLVALDYSQLELRIAASLSGDEKMIEAFRQGLDIHRLTAAAVLHVPLENVTPELRYRAKALNFGVLYGMGSRAFAESAGVSRDEAEHFIEEYFRNFSGIARFIEETKSFAREHGYTKTAFGRKRFFPDMGETNFRLQREAERMAVNHPIQGTGADIMKKAMIQINNFLCQRSVGGDAQLLLQIHDEFIFEMRRERIGECSAGIKAIMEQAWPSRVPLAVEVKQGAHWGEVE